MCYIHVHPNTKNVQEHLNVVLLYGELLPDQIVLTYMSTKDRER